MSLRLRLTLLYSVLFAVLIALFGTIVYTQTAKRLYSSVDDTLRTRADRILSAAAASPPQSAVRANQSVLDEIASPGVYVEIVDPAGTVVARSRNLTGALPVATRRHPDASGPTFETHETTNDERVRVLYEELPDGQGAMLVARSLHPTDASLDNLRWVLIGGGLVFLLVANGLAYLVAAPALRPIREATGTAAKIEATADFSRRIPGERQPGEVGELVRTLNELIAKVETTLDAHKAFIADSSHELRRPLAVIRGNLELLRSDALPAEERQQIIGEAESESRRMSRVLADLLLLSQVDARLILHLQPIELDAVIESVVERERQRFPNRPIRIERNGPVPVQADEQRVQQIFENLVENAARYSTEGTPIEIRLQRNGRFATAEVRDAGPGMSEEEQRHAFERFFRGPRGRRAHADGSGLGLAIVRHIAEAHGGGVTLTSSPAGTSVKVELPLASA